MISGSGGAAAGEPRNAGSVPYTHTPFNISNSAQAGDASDHVVPLPRAPQFAHLAPTRSQGPLPYADFQGMGMVGHGPTAAFSSPLPTSAPAAHKLGGKGSSLQHVPCKFYKSGACTAGKNCMFSHNRESTPDGFICRYFLKGNCKFGSKCALSHAFPERGPGASKPRRASVSSVHHHHLLHHQVDTSSTAGALPIAMMRNLTLSADWPLPQDAAASLSLSAGAGVTMLGREYRFGHRPPPAPSQQQQMQQMQHLHFSHYGGSLPEGGGFRLGAAAAFPRLPVANVLEHHNVVRGRPVNNLAASMQHIFDARPQPPPYPEVAAGSPTVTGGPISPAPTPPPPTTQQQSVQSQPQPQPPPPQLQQHTPGCVQYGTNRRSLPDIFRFNPYSVPAGVAESQSSSHKALFMPDSAPHDFRDHLPFPASSSAGGGGAVRNGPPGAHLRYGRLDSIAEIRYPGEFGPPAAPRAALNYDADDAAADVADIGSEGLLPSSLNELFFGPAE